MYAPRADRYEIWFCGHCPNAHVIFFDEDGVPICEATWSAAQADRLGAAIRARDPNFTTPTGGEMDR